MLVSWMVPLFLLGFVVCCPCCAGVAVEEFGDGDIGEVEVCAEVVDECFECAELAILEDVCWYGKCSVLFRRHKHLIL